MFTPNHPNWIRFAVALLLLALAADSTHGQATTVRYSVDLGKAATQRVHVSMSFDLTNELAGRDSVDLLMPAWRPGRYVILDPAGAVVGLSARDQAGQARSAQKVNKATWRIDTAGAQALTVNYELYANALGLRTIHADNSHAYLSGSAAFLYAPELRDQPIEVHFDAPTDWQIASGLELLPGSENAVVAADFDVLIDSPIEIGRHDRIDFEVANKPHEIIVWPPGRRFDRDRLINDFSAIIENQLEVFGRLPYDRYVFLVHAGAGAGGGTEHLNSTIMQVPSSRLEGSIDNNNDYRRFLGLVSHEFFHTWNVKQMRPSSMAPYDLQDENYSTLFWVAEGTTSYYDSLTLARTELETVDKYLEELGDLIDRSRNSPGSKVQSLSQSSYDAWVKFNRRSPDSPNTTVSFYGQGALASLFLDLRVRATTDDRRNLDQVMKALYERFPLDEGGYSRTDLEETVREISGRSWDTYFEKYIDGVEQLPLEEAFEHVGLELYLKADKPRNGAKNDPDEDGDANTDAAKEEEKLHKVADSGARLGDSDGKALVRSVRAGSAFYEAGILPGDELIALDGRRVSVDDWSTQIEAHRPGERVELHYIRHGLLQSIAITLGERTAAKWKLKRVKEPTQQQKDSYEAWLGHAWPDDKADQSHDKSDGTQGNQGGSR